MLSYWWADIKLQALKIYILYTYNDIWMHEWNVIHENFHAKHNMFTAPDEHMPSIIQLHVMSMQPANKAAEHLISSYD